MALPVTAAAVQAAAAASGELTDSEPFLAESGTREGASAGPAAGLSAGIRRRAVSTLAACGVLAAVAGVCALRRGSGADHAGLGMPVQLAENVSRQSKDDAAEDREALDMFSDSSSPYEGIPMAPAAPEMAPATQGVGDFSSYALPMVSATPSTWLPPMQQQQQQQQPQQQQLMQPPLQQQQQQQLPQQMPQQQQQSPLPWVPAVESCAAFGCGSFDETNSHCQCNSACEEFGTCCSDYQVTCPPAQTMVAPVPTQASRLPAILEKQSVGGFQQSQSAGHASGKQGLCSIYGCGGKYDPEQTCQCNQGCQEHSNCCQDFSSECSDSSKAGHGKDGSASGGKRGSSSSHGHKSSHSKDHESGRRRKAMREEEEEDDDDEDASRQRGHRRKSKAKKSSSSSKGSCADFGCVDYNEKQDCQCNRNCQSHGTCCADFESLCGGDSWGDGEDAQASNRFNDISSFVPRADASSFRVNSKGAQASEGSCATYGCVTYTEGNSCQCNQGCMDHGSCCADYKEHCSPEDGSAGGSAAADDSDGYFAAGDDFAVAPPHPGNAVGVDNCKTYGCVGFVEDHSCQCNDECRDHGSCCDDFEETCTGGVQPISAGGAGSDVHGYTAAAPPPEPPPPPLPADDAPWECYNYQAGQDGEWCKQVGTDDGFTYAFFEQPPRGPCGDCWCCRRPAPGAPPPGVAPGGLAFR